jgi:SAM-dependent methyltransferase
MSARRGTPAALDEQTRIAGVYDDYRRDPAKARAWNAQNAGNRALREELVGHVLAAVGDLIEGHGLLLDDGCGTGWWLSALRARGVPAERLVGVDLLEERVAAAREQVPGASLRQADASRLPLRDASCSLVTLFTVLSAMPSRAAVAAALAEARRVTAPGGAVVVWEPRVPTLNPHTRLVRRAELGGVLGGEIAYRSLTVAPPLARRLGRWYRPLSRLAPLRTHRLAVARIPMYTN